MPTNTNAVAGSPRCHARTDGVDHAGDLMTGHARINQVGPMSFFDEDIAVADSASCHFDADLGGPRFGNWPFGDGEIASGFCDLNGLHSFRHDLWDALAAGFDPKKVTI